MAEAMLAGGMNVARLQRLLPLIGIAAFAGAAFLVWRDVRPYGVAGMFEAVRRIPEAALILAMGCAAASYATLTLFDALALRYAGQRLAYRRVALASFIALSIGHTLGLAPLGSGALRARYYSRWGLDVEAIGKIILFCAATVIIGQTALAGLVLIVEPGPPGVWLRLAPVVVRGIGVLCLALVALYVAASWRLRRPVTIRGWRFTLPSFGIAIGQVWFGLLNFLFLTGALYALLAPAGQIDFWKIAAIYVLANIAALVSHVPGGLGVIEFVVLSFLPQASTWGALIVFRLVYYILPLGLGGLILGMDEIAAHALPLRPAARWRAALSCAHFRRAPPRSPR